MTVSRAILFMLCSLIISPGSKPTSAQGLPRDVRFKHLSIEEGLSQSTVFATLQDRQGYMWFATEDGLDRFDGYQFVAYRKQDHDSLSLPDNYVTSILEDSLGNLWVGTYSGGAAVLDRSTGCFSRITLSEWSEKGIRTNAVMSLTKDVQGNIWAAVWNSGVSRFDPRSRRWTHFTHTADSRSLIDNRVRYIYGDRTGRVWVCTFGGLDSFNPVTQQFTHHLNNSTGQSVIRDRRFMCAVEDRDGDLWFGTFEGGLVAFESRSSSFTHVIASDGSPSGLSSNRIASIGESEDGILWVGTWDAGVNLLDKRTGSIVVERATDADPQSLSLDAIRSVYGDRAGGMWIGTSGGGVNHFDPDRYKFRHLRQVKNNPQSLCNSNIRSLCETRNGLLWIGSTGGLDSYNLHTGAFRHYRHTTGSANGLSSDLITALLEDRSGRLWIGTDGGGLNMLDQRSGVFRTLRNVPGDSTTIGFDYIIALHEGREGVIWIGTSGGGLTRLDPRTLGCKRFQRRGSLANQISGNYVYAIYEDESGELWLGTWGAGVTVLDPATGRVRVYQHDPARRNSLNNNTVLDIFRDRQGNLWLGTLGGGVDKFDQTTDGFIHLTEADGLPNSTVYGILEDSSGRLWMSTNKGVACYDASAQAFRNYGVSDGLQSLEYSQNAFCKGLRGSLYFGGINGVNIIEPERLAVRTDVPPVAITQIKVMDHEVPVPLSRDRLLDLAPDQNFLSFTFSVLDYTAPEQNAYRYMLVGLEEHWNKAGGRHYAAYTDLQPGEYVLRLQGCNSDGVWNDKGASLRIRVNPPVWKTPWFRALAIAVILGMAFGFYRDRIQRLKKERAAQAEFSRKLNESQENERKRIAGELHDSLGQDLLTIKNRLARCSDGSASVRLKTEIAEVAAGVQHAIEEVREISSDLHPHMLERLGLTRTIESTARKCAASSGISIEATVDNVDGLLSPTEEINAFRIVQEGLNNVVKHSKASECTVMVQKNNGECLITIKDDGCGFVPQRDPGERDTHGGFGLLHMAERVRLLHGSMDVVSTPGNGTTLRLAIPLSLTRNSTPS
jgi:signal transduction histidine kinase/ligand-binding sensor domain-containing protein